MAVCDWCALPSDMLESIAIRVLTSGSAEDFMAFRGVCTSWRAVATKNIFHANYIKPWPYLPYLMLAEKQGTHDREFYNVSTKQVCGELALPEIAGKRCIEARFGWMLTLTNSGEVGLFNPSSRSRIELPNFKTFPEYRKSLQLPQYRFFTGAVLSANPSHTSDFVLLVYNFDHLGFWKNGEDHWNLIKSMRGRKISPIPSAVNYSDRDHKFYAINQYGNIYAWDPSGSGDLTVAEKIFCVDPTITCTSFCVIYVVESSAGELLLVARNGELRHYGSRTYGTTKFKVFRIDVEEKKYEEIQSLGDDAIFVGHNAAFSISASRFLGAIKPNCIYFTDGSVGAYIICCLHEYYDEEDALGYNSDTEEGESSDGERGDEKDEACQWVWETGNIHGEHGGGENMGIYNVEDGSIERLGETAETPSFVCPPLWVALSSSFCR